MEFTDLGKHCDFCNKQDYLPFNCDKCKKYFCKEHWKQHNCKKKEASKEDLVSEIVNFLKKSKALIDENFSVIVNLGPGSFSGIRISLAIAKGLEISKNIKLFGFYNENLKTFDLENIEKMLSKNLIEKKLIKPLYLS